MEAVKKILKGIGILITICLTFVYILFLVSTTTISTTKKIVSEKNINKILKEIDFLSLPASEITKTYDSDKTIKDLIEEELEKKGVNKNITNDVIASDELIDFISGYASKYIEYILKDNPKPTITEQEIKNIISVSKIEQSLGIDITDKQETEFNNFIKATVNEINKELPTKEDIVKDNRTKELIENINILFTDNALVFMIIYLVVIYLIMALCRWSIYKPLMWTGISNIIVGIFLSMIYVLQYFIVKTYTNNEGTIDIIVKNLSDKVFKNFLITGLITIGVGISSIIIYNIVKKIISNNNAKVNKKEKTIID